MSVRLATAADASTWDAFIASQRFRPFLQSWTMGEVYAETNQEPVRLIAEENGKVVGVCLAIFVPARRGQHLAIQYGPITRSPDVALALVKTACDEARMRKCTFIRMSPFTPYAEHGPWTSTLENAELRPVHAPMHLLAEHLWYLPLHAPDKWVVGSNELTTLRTEDEILMGMRKTTRNLVRRAEKDGVTVRASTDPTKDVEEFIKLHDETRKRHKFTPYTNAFFRAQVKHFAPRNECTVYLAEFEGKIIAASIHMHAFGETSYHHGASDSAHNKIPSSYLVQWTAIRDALKRGDGIYNFWGIAPLARSNERVADSTNGSASRYELTAPRHPFAGVTLFKTGFGGHLLDLQPCTDIPLGSGYTLTRWFEVLRKWKRGF